MVNKKESKPVDREIGARLRARRVMLGWSQEKLGDAIGLTFQQVQKYEKGANRIGGSRLVQIATVLKCEPSYFFGGNGSGKASEIDAITMLIQRADTHRLLEAFDCLEGPVRASVVNHVEALAAQAGRSKR